MKTLVFKRKSCDHFNFIIAIQFGTKFGADPADTIGLLRAAKQLELNVVGVRYIYCFKNKFVFNRYTELYSNEILWRLNLADAKKFPNFADDTYNSFPIFVK